ncbi:MAG: ATPase, T2SS/T4P/T4SS family [Capsulimonadaceae bacterium]|nr:ATPase, T2SS/T4P/T4SS family [Capsulimonadaceae bacterium]
MAFPKKSLGDYLVETGVLTEDQLRQAKDVQKSAPGDLGNIIVDLGFASERNVTACRAREMGLPFIDLSRQTVDPDLLKLVPEHIVKRYNVLPVKKESNNRLLVAVSDPKSSIVALDDIRIVSKHQPVPALATKSDIEDAIKRLYADTGGNGKSAFPANGNGRGNGAGRRPGSATPALIPTGSGGPDNTPALIDESASPVAPSSSDAGGQSGTAAPAQPASGVGSLQNALQGDLLNMIGAAEDDNDEEAMRDMADDAPIVRIGYTIVLQAIREGASDIHIEPEKRGVRIRYRIDGVLNEIMQVPKHIQAPLISRFKILADLNIAERRVPQDGRIPIRHEGKEYDLRVNCCPTNFGEKIVMRVLDKSNVLLPLEKLGFHPDVMTQMDDLITQPNGLFLTCGPTGSGKTTTLYSILNKINTPEKNIMTVEDPVEYILPGISQVHVQKKAGMTFAAALRAFLRQDPDVIMVGEIRDLETAQIAVEAALTGHLVLSTIHTNSASEAVMRLADMGIEPFLLSATVSGVIGQRLSRRVCGNCKEPYEVQAESLRRFGFPVTNPREMITLYRGRGCETCRGKGYKGRLGLYELLKMNDEIRELVVRRAPALEVRDAARASGMKELREDGLWKVLQGMTTPEEVMRVVFTGT